jgi:hypothetical protein
MHTIKLELDDTLYEDVIKKGIDVQSELKKALHKIIYAKEYKIANDINQSLNDIKSANSRPLAELFNEV